MVIEDDDLVRSVVARTLSAAGYNVLAAVDGPVALQMMVDRPELPIHLLVVDIVMPKLDGPALVKQVVLSALASKCSLFRAIPRMCCGTRAGLRLRSNCCKKPFSPDLLARRVRDVLDSKYGKAL